ncbi:hypothetical protein WJX84_002217 [Apatococcus fuscideae]|uniref:Armadillo repeat-containing protein 8 n=1 Tax=Apatococcus fuscideae TaxID=2026836 RepID=A0AAW1SX84_9CHLO
MVARPEDLVSRLSSSSDPESRLKALRDIKNQVIGNKRKKRLYLQLGAITSLVQILEQSDSTQLLIQCTTAAGSLAYGSQQGAEAFLANSGLEPLLRTLWSSEHSLVEAGLRTLRSIFQNGAKPAEQQVSADAFAQLVMLAGSSNHNVAVGAARLLPVFCTTQTQANILEQKQGIKMLLALSHAVRSTHHDLVLEALACLTAQWPSLMRAAFAEDASIKRKIEEQLKSPSPEARFVACRCLANYCQGRTFEVHERNTLQSQVIPTLVRLLGDPAVRFSVPRCLNSIIEGNEALQKVATDFEAIPKLAALLQTATAHTALLDLLRTLSTLCQHQEDNRRQVLKDYAILKQILAALESSEAPVRVAACSCLRGLSRSVKNLRCSLVDVDIAHPLMKLLADSNLENLAFRGSTTVKGSIMSALPWTALTSLLRDEETELQAKSLSLLQNLVHGSNTSMTQLTAWTGGNILEELAQVLHRTGEKDTSLQEHAMQTLGNLAGIGGEEERDEIISNPSITGLLPTLLRSSEERLRLAALWLIINIIPAGDQASSLAARRSNLQLAGVLSIVQHLKDSDPSQDIRERAITASNRFATPAEEPQA